jgi:hypothetical protein
VYKRKNINEGPVGLHPELGNEEDNGEGCEQERHSTAGRSGKGMSSSDHSLGVSGSMQNCGMVEGTNSGVCGVL